ncbi:hypothetical protein [Paraburkholderia caribensis]|uniref:hypothetical protein n=1 Tax=Paraburkholderia caribensis TaxID=75105 RepID=UPI00131480FC|nr:hypothetical protein [Paraburkholderia caribensis]
MRFFPDVVERKGGLFTIAQILEKTFAAAAAGREVFWLHDLFIDRGDIGNCV